MYKALGDKVWSCKVKITKLKRMFNILIKGT